MDKKSFGIIIVLLLVTFGLAHAIRSYRPASAGAGDFEQFPRTIGDWYGQEQIIPEPVLEVLNPEAIYAAQYVNAEGREVHLLFDFFSSDAKRGGPHSPRNCLPGSGWIIKNVTRRTVPLGDRVIEAGRFELSWQNQPFVMDFWYVTHWGETANDYAFKLHEMLTSLTFRPRDIGFVRFIAPGDPDGLAALEEFQQQAVPEIYRLFPFGDK